LKFGLTQEPCASTSSIDGSRIFFSTENRPRPDGAHLVMTV
jgi:hypothetical protein